MDSVSWGTPDVKAFTIFAALPALFLAWPASAQTYLTYQFTGNCEDCNPASTPAIAVLVLQDYRPGDELTTSNLVSFTYQSNLVTWPPQNIGDILDLGLSGQLGTSTGTYDVSFNERGLFGDGLIFTTGHDSFNYDVVNVQGVPGGLDHGTGTWTLVSGAPAVPEVTTWATMAAGLGVVGAGLRRRREGALPAR